MESKKYLREVWERFCTMTQVTDKNLLTEIERIPPQAKDKQWTAKWIVGRLNNLSKQR